MQQHLSENHFDDSVLQENIPLPPLFWKSPDRSLCIFEPHSEFQLWEEQLSSWFPGFLLPFFKFFWRIQHDPAFISCSFSAQRQFSNIFPGIQSHNFCRHIVGSFPEDFHWKFHSPTAIFVWLLLHANMKIFEVPK